MRKDLTAVLEHASSALAAAGRGDWKAGAAIAAAYRDYTDALSSTVLLTERRLDRENLTAGAEERAARPRVERCAATASSPARSGRSHTA
jgi:hypothetical protein